MRRTRDDIQLAESLPFLSMIGAVAVGRVRVGDRVLRVNKVRTLLALVGVHVSRPSQVPTELY